MRTATLPLIAVGWFVAVAAPLAQVATGSAGSWTVASQPMSTVVRLGVGERGSWNTFDVERHELTGLSPAALTNPAAAPVTFSLRRDAGVLAFDGVVRGGAGGGTFTFAPNAAFAGELAKRGIKGLTREQHYELALADVGYRFVDELRRQRYELPADAAVLVRAAQHGVGLAYLRDIGALGYSLSRLDALVRLHDHGVSARYISELQAQGLGRLSADDLVHARSHGVSADYVRGMAANGFRNLPLAELSRARDHGVTPEYAGAMRVLGYRNGGIELLIRFRSHGVSPEYVRELLNAGLRDLPAETLVRFRAHGVTPREVGEIRALGYNRVTGEQLIALRNHGLSPDRVRRINARAGERLPVEQLTAAAARGGI